MKNLLSEIGAIYDSIIFLNLIHNKTTTCSALCNANNEYFIMTEKEFVKQNVKIPEYFNVLFYNFNFISNELFNDTSLLCYSKEKLYHKFSNESYMKQLIIKSICPDMSFSNISRLATKSMPYPYELLSNISIPQHIITSLMYILQYYDFFKEEFFKLFNITYDILTSIHLDFIDNNTALVHEFNSPVNLARIASILKTPFISKENMIFTFSLIDTEKFTFTRTAPYEFLLGIHYKKSLDLNYKFVEVTLFSFSLALGHDVKYDIYKTLQEFTELSTAELSKKLHKSKTAIKYHLDDMTSERIIIVSNVKSLTNYYSLNREYLIFMSKLLSEQVALCNSPKKILAEQGRHCTSPKNIAL